MLDAANSAKIQVHLIESLLLDRISSPDNKGWIFLLASCDINAKYYQLEGSGILGIRELLYNGVYILSRCISKITETLNLLKYDAFRKLYSNHESANGFM